MILWASKEKVDDRDIAACSVHRDVLEIGRYYLSWNIQGKFKSDGQWKEVHTRLSVCATKVWDLGSQHFYYDGNHCFFSLGYLHFYRQKVDCKKCL
jgi:hypothetical protein